MQVAKQIVLFVFLMLPLSILKETVQRDFLPPFFSSFEPAWATEQWVKIFSILVKIWLSYSNFSESL